MEGVSLTNLKFTGAGYNPWSTFTLNEPIPWNEYFMRGLFRTSFIAQRDAIKTGSELYAATCFEPGYAGSKVGVDTLYLITINKYNNNFLAGDTLNSIVRTNRWTFSVNDFYNFGSLEKYIEDNKTVIQETFFEMKLDQEPSEASARHQFKLIYVLKDGKRFEAQTQLALLTK